MAKVHLIPGRAIHIFLEAKYVVAGFSPRPAMFGTTNAG
jgi:hypothetical protein